jgi:hypothetical protein
MYAVHASLQHAPDRVYEIRLAAGVLVGMNDEPTRLVYYGDVVVVVENTRALVHGGVEYRRAADAETTGTTGEGEALGGTELAGRG